MAALRRKQSTFVWHIYMVLELSTSSGLADRSATHQQKEEISELQLFYAAAQKKQNQPWMGM